MTEPESREDIRTPLSFKVMVVLVVLYLGWRLVQVLGWLWDWLF